MMPKDSSTDLDTQVRAQLALSRLPGDQSRCLPAVVYTDGVFAAREQERLFRSGWFGIGRADRFALAGDYETLDVAGQALIVLRDKAGKLRAFANSCRHRGARLLEGQGTCRGIRCPFHAWAYRLDGSLAAAPQMDGADFDRDAHHLVAWRAEEYLGFAFLCRNPDAPPLADVLGDFPTLHAPWPLASLVSVRRRSMVVACNWKLFLDVFNEYYHLASVHRESINDVYNEPDPGDAVSGAYASQFGSTEGTGSQLQGSNANPLPAFPGMTGRAAAGVRYTWVFPNMAFAACVDALWIYEAYPLGAGRCLVFQTTCVTPETRSDPEHAGAIARLHDRLDASVDEDVPALVNQQRGLASPDARQGPFQMRLEPNVAAFANWYAGKIV